MSPHYVGCDGLQHAGADATTCASDNNNKVLQYWQCLCCYIANKVENIDHVSNIPNTLQWAGRSPPPIQSDSKSNPDSPQISPSPGVGGILQFLGPTWVHIPKGTSIGTSIFAGLTVVTDRHAYTDHRTSISIGSFAYWCRLVTDYR